MSWRQARWGVGDQAGAVSGFPGSLSVSLPCPGCLPSSPWARSVSQGEISVEGTRGTGEPGGSPLSDCEPPLPPWVNWYRNTQFP